MSRTVIGRRKQREHQIDRLIVNRIIFNRLIQTNEYAYRTSMPFDLAMRDRGAAAKARRPKPLALNKRFMCAIAVKAIIVRSQRRDG